MVELISSVNQDKERLFLINNRQAKLIDEATVCCVNCLEKISIEDFELAAEELKQSRARLDDFIGSKSADDLLVTYLRIFVLGNDGGILLGFWYKNNMHSLYIHMPQKSKKAYPCLSTAPSLCANSPTRRYQQKKHFLIKTTKNIFLYLLLFLYV